jgi:PIN domain nuclease of toxin-antitoxin system
LRLLLDTCTFLWLANGSPRLSKSVREAFRDSANPVYLSGSSAWEISIKHRLGQIDLPEPAEEYVPKRISVFGLILLEISLPHALRAGSLPLHHKDPFDRMLIAQAEVEGLSIATPDPAFDRYGATLVW